MSLASVGSKSRWDGSEIDSVINEYENTIDAETNKSTASSFFRGIAKTLRMLHCSSNQMMSTYSNIGLV